MNISEWDVDARPVKLSMQVYNDEPGKKLLIWACLEVGG